MAIIATQGYLETAYLTQQYLVGHVQDGSGVQLELIIKAKSQNGVQVDQQIDNDIALGSQSELRIDKQSMVGMQIDGFLKALDARGMQSELGIRPENINAAQTKLRIDKQPALGHQIEAFILDKKSQNGIQVDLSISSIPKTGVQIDQRIDTSNINGIQVDQQIKIDKKSGVQIEGIVKNSTLLGTQVRQNIVDFIEPFGLQVDQQIKDDVINGIQVEQIIENLFNVGNQTRQEIKAEELLGLQARMRILDIPEVLGTQVDQKVLLDSVVGMQVKIYPLPHWMCEKYLLSSAYLTDSYLAPCMKAGQSVQVLQKIVDFAPGLGIQVEQRINTTDIFAAQVEQRIDDIEILATQVEQRLDALETLAAQVQMRIDIQDLLGTQVEQRIDFIDNLGTQTVQRIFDDKLLGIQVELRIDADKALGTQVEQYILDKLTPTGVQVIKYSVSQLGTQAGLVIYNTTQLRILSNFASRGTPAQNGNNWTSMQSLKPGDFISANLNTDQLEQRCQTNGIKNFWELRCDTGISQGVFVDTVAILAHNLSKSARVTLQGTQDSSWGNVEFSVVMTTELDNMYWIAPTLPTISYRYWRFIIQDATNPAADLFIGVIVFGSAQIVSKSECFENPISFGVKHFKNTVQTEGYTSVSNDRAIRKFLSLSFAKVLFDGGNYRLLKEFYLNAKTDLKCLIIPTPETPSGLAVFSKLTQLPEESHTAISPRDHFVDLSLSWDESL